MEKSTKANTQHKDKHTRKKQLGLSCALSIAALMSRRESWGNISEIKPGESCLLGYSRLLAHCLSSPWKLKKVGGTSDEENQETKSKCHSRWGKKHQKQTCRRRSLMLTKMGKTQDVKKRGKAGPYLSHSLELFPGETTSAFVNDSNT